LLASRLPKAAAPSCLISQLRSSSPVKLQFDLRALANCVVRGGGSESNETRTG